MIEISTDNARLDVALIHRFLSEESYWATHVPRDVVERSIANSLCFAAYEDGRQVGFARVITDRATFAYLADVFVVPSHRGRGVGKSIMDAIRKHADLQGLRRWMLATRDAHGLYRQYGFGEVANPRRLMEIVVANAYEGSGAKS